MWKKYQAFLRKRTDNQLLVGAISSILIVTVVLAVNNVFQFITIYVVLIFLGLFVMTTFCKELEERSVQYRKELEREANEKMREEMRKE